MSLVSVNHNNKSFFFHVRDVERKTGESIKNIDAQTLMEIWNDNVYQVHAEHLSGDRVVIDAGAHIGTFSVFAAALGAAKVYSLEPNVDNLTILKQNAAQNNFENIITPIHRALWSSHKTVKVNPFYTDSRVDSVAHLESAVSKAVTPEDTTEQFIAETISLDALMDQNDIKEIDVFKCDVEWSEYEFIPSWSDELMAKIKYLVIEFHGTDEATYGKLLE
jgi:FkbM family methyltransferase